MYPIIYGRIGTDDGVRHTEIGVRAFDLGHGILSDAVSVIVKMEINGEYTATVQCPCNGRHVDDVEPFSTLLIKTNSRQKYHYEYQPFIVYAINKSMNGIVTFECFHISYMTRYAVSVSDTVGLYSNSDINSQILNYNGREDYFEVAQETWTDSKLYKIPRTVREQFGPELAALYNKKVYEAFCDRWQMYRKRNGGIEPYTIRYGQNMTGLNCEVDFSNTFTSVAPYYAQEADKTMQIRTLTSVYVDSSHVNDYPYRLIKPLDLTAEFDSKPSESALRNKAIEWMNANKPWNPDISILVNFVDLSRGMSYGMYDDDGFKHLTEMELGDDVTVVHEKLGIDISARAVAVTYDALKERVTDATIANKRMKLSSYVKGGK